MIAAMAIPITKTTNSKLKELDIEKLSFGKQFTDHMLEADFVNGEWKNVQIVPYQPVSFSPSLSALHYGQAIFEGIKAYKNQRGEPYIFRPYENFRRFNISANRMQMPEVPEEIFMEGMRQLISLERDWIPATHDHSLYIRPFMFSSDEMIGVKPSDNYRFMIILCPTGPYYSSPMRIYVEEKYTRAAPGGVGFAKAAGNYGAAMLATAEAKQKGYDQVMWTDCEEHRYIHECGTMNVFFIINNNAITPSLDQGTILEGVTRGSVITLLKEMGLTVEERSITINEVMDAYKTGSLKEVFGTGTAATISMIKELLYKDFVMHFDTDTWKFSPTIKKDLTDIREGRTIDKYGWMWKV
jgi:branched-chain amino acid aminotransferase